MTLSIAASCRTRALRSTLYRGASADEKQIARNRRRSRRAISRSVSVSALAQISLSPSMEELPSRQTISGPLPCSSTPRKSYCKSSLSTKRRIKSLRSSGCRRPANSDGSKRLNSAPTPTSKTSSLVRSKLFRRKARAWCFIRPTILASFFSLSFPARRFPSSIWRPGEDWWPPPTASPHASASWVASSRFCATVIASLRKRLWVSVCTRDRSWSSCLACRRSRVSSARAWLAIRSAVCSSSALTSCEISSAISACSASSFAFRASSMRSCTSASCFSTFQTSSKSRRVSGFSDFSTRRAPSPKSTVASPACPSSRTVASRSRFANSPVCSAVSNSRFTAALGSTLSALKKTTLYLNSAQKRSRRSASK